MALPNNRTGTINGVGQYKRSTFYQTAAEQLVIPNWFQFNDETDTFGYYNWHGDPNGSVTADKGSWCSDTTTPAMYFKTTDASNTGWVLFTLATTDLHTAKWIVNATTGAGGNQSTIQAAINAAVAGETVFVYPGTYTENLSLKAGVDIVTFGGEASSGQVTIIGKATFTGAGTVNLSNIRLQTNSDFALSVTGSSASVVNLVNCYLNGSNNTPIQFTSSSSSAQINLINSFANLGTTGISYWTHSSAGTINIFYCNFMNSGSSTTATTTSAGNLSISYSRFGAPITTSSTNRIVASSTSFDCTLLNTTALTVGGSGANSLVDCDFLSGTATALSLGSSTNIVSGCDFFTSNTTAIGGAGTISYANLSFTSTSSTIGTTTQKPLVTSNDALKVTTPGAYPYTTVPQDAVILVDSSSARTITPLASPTTGQVHIIKDASGLAATNNITITPSGKNIDGSASAVISTNYAALKIVYNGTQWNII